MKFQYQIALSGQKEGVIGENKRNKNGQDCGM